MATEQSLGSLTTLTEARPSARLPSRRSKGYSIDLSKRNIAALEKALEPYISAARAGRARVARGRGTRRVASRSPSKAMDPGAVRVWARANGYDVSDRGRIGASVLSAYEAAK